ncbi:P-loop containing nucleoside triphosphate hydrolase [Syntrophomonas zehnderi OL-4]|uniref:p-loop containing nucleoside triphosphate hydrolase n=1 Tax=Syntrophomonas zehnderi OL-4 TaxID=690567 RepID=A0A0E3W385_9FIRM|nr:hypothetical protein [Syntrophomonas zehnderi]CFX61535.1 P-loop containing nucleoside triphosphate hydrolase [Syntrophomonas zehnderi OL-4]
MAKVRNMFPGGNSCYGFFSFYNHIVPETVNQKIILKGGPGVGKSTFMKKIGEILTQQQIDVEYHWCSSDNHSLDGVVGGNRQVCVLDGTSPHVVDPRYPGAVDRIINLGEFWDKDIIAANRASIIGLTDHIGLCFQRAYNRLSEARLALEEWQTYIKEACDYASVNRNVLALGEDFLHSSKAPAAPRHLFAAAISPEGVVTKADSLIDPDYAISGVKGSPGGGCKDLFTYVEKRLQLEGIYAEIYHCPFDPKKIDMIIIPENKSILIDISSHVVDYEKILPNRKFKRFLDFDQFLDKQILNPYAKLMAMCRERFTVGISEAVSFINTAKTCHDKLETYYVPAMDFARVEELSQETAEALLKNLAG